MQKYQLLAEHQLPYQLLAEMAEKMAYPTMEFATWDIAKVLSTDLLRSLSWRVCGYAKKQALFDIKTLHDRCDAPRAVDKAGELGLTAEEAKAVDVAYEMVARDADVKVRFFSAFDGYSSQDIFQEQQDSSTDTLDEYRNCKVYPAASDE